MVRYDISENDVKELLRMMKKEVYDWYSNYKRQIRSAEARKKRSSSKVRHKFVSTSSGKQKSFLDKTIPNRNH